MMWGWAVAAILALGFAGLVALAWMIVLRLFADIGE